MSDIIILFRMALPVLSLLALTIGLVTGLVLLIYGIGGMIPRRPRVVATQRHRDLTRRREPSR
ncbi:hypothetical protein [Rhodopseudomonas palustris]|uniref:hypothetical protein n=1 Tax=Rhodopseudomonas palustris TaxID=1076 RepID=UPI00059FC1D7|nr:hypothetical protein [Rhodopseudomonas palustris]